MSTKKSVSFTEKSQLLEPPPHHHHNQTNANFISFCCNLFKYCLITEYDSDDTEQIYTGSDSEDDASASNTKYTVKQVNFTEYEMDVTRYKGKPLLSYVNFSKKYNTPPTGSVPLLN